LICSVPCIHGGKVLIPPVEGSHWVNMNILIEAMHARGHTITVLRPEKSWYIKKESPHYSTVTIPHVETIDEQFIKNMMILLEMDRGNSSMWSLFSLQKEMLSKFTEAHKRISGMASSMLEDQQLMKSLQDTQYDLVLTDPVWGVGILLAHYLQVPLVYNVRWTVEGEGHFAIAPSPISYIPITGSGLTDQMNIIERLKNMLFYGLMRLQDTFLIRPLYQAVCDQYFGPEVDFYALLQSADLWLMRVDFVFEFPRPTMPNVVYMGGFQCQPAKPLPQDLEEFVLSSGEHGVIVMSLGTFVSELPSDIMEDIASAFAQLPQKVIWKHKGHRPANLGNNTLLMDWIPQNDLLGHPKTRVFVAHGGTNGMYEAIYHGTPVVGLPLFFDQYDNLMRLKVRGGAKILQMNILDKSLMLQALQEVINEPSYRINMQRLSSLHRDQPMKPLDRALYWIEFVMRHKGAAHLRTESYRMPWYIYHSVDVIVVLLVTLFVFLFTAIAVIKLLCCRVCSRRKVKYE
ncbi:UD2A1 glucuronosyltransferase, partial [Amia calva]|nr:UD2A1 glucuronosyltransferase [Amia calva]